MPSKKFIIECQFDPTHTMLRRHPTYCLDCAAYTGLRRELGPEPSEFDLRFDGEKLDTDAPTPRRA